MLPYNHKKKDVKMLHLLQFVCIVLSTLVYWERRVDS